MRHLRRTAQDERCVSTRCSRVLVIKRYKCPLMLLLPDASLSWPVHYKLLSATEDAIELYCLHLASRCAVVDTDCFIYTRLGDTIDNSQHSHNVIVFITPFRSFTCRTTEQTFRNQGFVIHFNKQINNIQIIRLKTTRLFYKAFSVVMFIKYCYVS